MFESFDEAFNNAPFVSHQENRVFLRHLLAGLDIDHYEILSGSIKAVRTDDHPALQIRSGYTDGFTSKGELEALGVTAAVWQSQDRAKGAWGVNHPVVGASSTTGPSTASKKHGDQCDKCHTTKSLTGACDCD